MLVAQHGTSIQIKLKHEGVMEKLDETTLNADARM